jgi:hypothetical protein
MFLGRARQWPECVLERGEETDNQKGAWRYQDTTASQEHGKRVSKETDKTFPTRTATN